MILKKTCGETLQQNKNHVGETLQQFTIFFFEKSTKLNSQPAQYEKNKINKDHLKKIIKRKKNYVWKY